MPTMNRRAAKRDDAEKPIIKALEQAGVSVVQLSDRAIPDLLCGWNEANYLIEVKTGKAKLNDDQSEFFKTWKGQKGLARTPQEALQIIGISKD
jgi:Holliday junction resolvase